MPLTRTGRTARPSGSGRAMVVVDAFSRVSVVIRAPAAASRPASVGVSRGASEATPGRTRSSGRRVPMMPVERRSTSVGRAPNATAVASATRSWSASPAAPVAALADPDVETTALARPERPPPPRPVAKRLAWLRRTGAAANRFGVKTAAAGTASPVAATSARSGRPLALIPIAMPPATKPAGMTACRSTVGRADGSSTCAGSASSVMAPAAAARARSSRPARTRD